MNEIELLNRYNDIHDLFKKLYFIYQDEGIKIPRTYNGKWWPYHYLTISCGIEVEVTLSTAKFDYKHEEDEYTHALGRAAMDVLFNPECELSEKFNRYYLDILYEKELFFEDRKRYVFPYEIYEKGEGGLKRFTSTSYLEGSWFSYQFFLVHLYAYKDKDDMYLSYNGETLISEDDFKDLMNRIDKEVDILKEIYQQYYQDVISPIYEKTDLLIDDFEEVRKYLRDNKLLEHKHFLTLEKILNIYDELLERYNSFIDEKNIEQYVRSKRP